MQGNKTRTTLAVAAVGAAGTLLATMTGTGTGVAAPGTTPHAATTPIKHVVVIFQENVSFDHYFGTYPTAANTGGQTFQGAATTPSVNGLTDQLLTANPNGTNPKRYDPTNINDVLTCDQDHDYTDEENAFDGGKMDKFVTAVGNGSGTSPEGGKCVAGDVMNYYDGNTVTAMWNYAQHFAMSDNSYGTTFGPSSPGAINLVSGDTGNVDTTHEVNDPSSDLVADGLGGMTMISDAQPYWDDCSLRDAAAMKGKNVGDRLNAAGLSWGWFQGGFRPTTSFATAAPGQPTSTFTPDQFKGKFAQKPASDEGLCNAVHPVGAGLTSPLAPGTGQYGYKDDYIPHHEPFQYYASTANPHHLTVPTDAQGNDTVAGLKTIGSDTQHYKSGVPQFDTPNHQYDMSDFDQLVAAINSGALPASALPAVSFLKAAGYQDGHAGYSDPFDEQQFVVKEINALEKSPDWKSTVVVIAYDDSDGWYDHAYSGVVNPSDTSADSLTGANKCGSGGKLGGEDGRCGYGPRLPLLVISPWAKKNYVDHTLTDQSSILRFIEDNWRLPRIGGSFDRVAGTLDGMFTFNPANGTGRATNAPLTLDPTTGQPAS